MVTADAEGTAATEHVSEDGDMSVNTEVPATTNDDGSTTAVESDSTTADVSSDGDEVTIAHADGAKTDGVTNEDGGTTTIVTDADGSASTYVEGADGHVVSATGTGGDGNDATGTVN